jgi:cytochrome c-type biogenesis protein CcsB
MHRPSPNNLRCLIVTAVATCSLWAMSFVAPAASARYDSAPTSAPAVATVAPAATDAAPATTRPSELITESAEMKPHVGPLELDVTPLRTLSVQDRQTLKTLDTWARQTLSTITKRSKIDGREPLYSVLDMATRPWEYSGRNIVHIRNVPLRQDMAGLPGIDKAEARRILEEGTVSVDFWMSPGVQHYLVKLQNQGVFKTDAIAQVQTAATTLTQLPEVAFRLQLVPPEESGKPWEPVAAFSGNIPALGRLTAQLNHDVAPHRAGYNDEQLSKAYDHFSGMLILWQVGRAKEVQDHIKGLAATLPQVRPSAYPSELKRKAEVLYNRTFQLTLPGAALYFTAFVLFLVAARTLSKRTTRIAIAFVMLGFLLHTAGVAIRWWLVEKSTDDWFHSIPIKNQFESVMMAAWLGMLLFVTVGLLFRRYINLTGAAATFVGWLSMIALFTVPYVFGKEIGGQIGQVNGILMSYYLYVHVTLAVFSYALIGMGFLLSAWWLIKFALNTDLVEQVNNPRQLSADALDDGDESEAADKQPGHTTLASLTAGPTPALAGFGAVNDAPAQSRSASIGSSASSSPVSAEVSRFRAFMAKLDACNLVILQLAFWVLGVAIVLGAVWADVSWGRPWGWDPKETFALVTWICYLIVVHARIATKHKAFWTAILSVIGFFVMLFNWIGVNYFLVGLHSYA